ncbi:leucine aminopeptidase [Caulobacter vibrioides CB15]|uniref:Probable cytosol aminopeptidase n=1 Tax=Caulobacter vibrioides (strain ATCC 19089 / CIP 103742 / CB 15) TaxID=190650 RepID=Q9A9K3_CAUVC|nr:leucine aminopeptidase [Caulobacter vibrioides CB15]ATC27810.1 leucyl aminopeptidase [Caulobacter vibrioides]
MKSVTSRTRALAVSAIALMGAFVVTASDVAAAQTLSRPAEAPSITPRTVNFSNSAVKAAGVLVLPLSGAGDLAKRGAGLETATRQAIERALRSAAFGYGARQTLTLRGLGDWDRVVVVGLGASAADPQWSGAVVGRALVNDSAPVTVLTGGLPAETVAAFATGMGIGHYRSDLYQAGRRSAAPGGPVTLITDFPDAARSSFQARGLALVEAMTWARDVSNEPANVIYPETFVDRARAAFAGVPGVRIEVLDVPAMARLGMGALLGVGQGSERPPRLLVVRYQGQGAPEGGPIALVGKGITFDSGGISIKAAAGMGNMKMDMSGAAAVTASVLALARSKAPVDVVAVAALAENMPDGRAIRPGDVLTAMNGKSIEIINTDAEGRLVLADALVWTERNLKPAAVVDVATLTGAVGGALGDDYAGLFSRHDALAGQLEAAGRATGERLWRLPLNASHETDMSSTIADLKNTGEGGGGASTGAWFIGEFVSRDIPWAHLDIANMAWGGAGDWSAPGSAGFAVRLLEQFVRDWRPVAREPGAGGG